MSIESDTPARAAPVTEDESLRHLIGEALRGSRRDLTSAPLGRAILLLAIPMVTEMIMESVFAVVDIYWVSRLGADALASVNLTESMVAIVFAVAAGLSTGAMAVVSRRIGEKDPAGAARATVQVILLGVVVSALFGAAGVMFGPQLLKIMGGAPAAVAIGSGYARTLLGGSVTIVLLFLINAAFRGAGDAAVAMRTLWLANGINILLGPFLVFGWGPFPRLGVTGAAVATTIGRGIGVLYQLRALRRGRGLLAVRREHLRLDLPVMGNILRISGSGVVQVLVGMTSWSALVRILATFGSNVLAGYGLAMRVVMFAILPSWGLANAAATLLGQNLGAGHPERAERAVRRAAVYNFFFLGGVGLVLVALAPRVIGIFTQEAEVLFHGVRALRVVGAGFLFYGYGMVYNQAFNGAGDTRTPTLLNLFCFWLWEIPIAYLLARVFGLGPTGVFASITIAFSTLAVLAWLFFRRGNWKKSKV
jgi:putative MATE family efflux protein